MVNATWCSPIRSGVPPGIELADTGGNRLPPLRRRRVSLLVKLLSPFHGEDLGTCPMLPLDLESKGPEGLFVR